MRLKMIGIFTSIIFQGCPMADFCIDYDPNSDCPSVCPVQSCGQTEILCQDYDYESGCLMSEYCEPAYYFNYNGYPCDSWCQSDSACPPDMYSCESPYDANGCQVLQ